MHPINVTIFRFSSRGWSSNYNPRIRNRASYDIWSADYIRKAFPSSTTAKTMESVLNGEITRNFLCIYDLTTFKVANELGFSARQSKNGFISNISLPDTTELMGRILKLNAYLDEDYKIVIGFYEIFGQQINSIEYLERFVYEGLLPLARYDISPEFFEHDMNAHVPAIVGITPTFLKWYQEFGLNILKCIKFLKSKKEDLSNELTSSDILLKNKEKIDEYIKEISKEAARQIDANMANLTNDIEEYRENLKTSGDLKLFFKRQPKRQNNMFHWIHFTISSILPKKYVLEFLESVDGKMIDEKDMPNFIHESIITAAERQIKHIENKVRKQFYK